MALGILGVIFLVIMIVSAAFAFALLFKDGYYVSNTWIFALVQVFIIILAILNITALPDNFIFEKVISGLLIAAAIFNVWFKEKNFKLSRIISIVLLAATVYMLFF